MGNHDNHRLASRYKPTRADLFNILLKTLPGITVTYQGEELALTDVHVSWLVINNEFLNFFFHHQGDMKYCILFLYTKLRADTKDPQACRTNPNVYHEFSRDPARTPFQWDNSTNAGFSTADKTWLPVAENFTENNVQLQKSQVLSHLKLFRKLITLRKNPAFKYGGLQIESVNDDVLIYKREIDGKADANIYVVLLNLGTSYKAVELSTYFQQLPRQMRVAVASIQSETLVIGLVDFFLITT